MAVSRGFEYEYEYEYEYIKEVEEKEKENGVENGVESPPRVSSFAVFLHPGWVFLPKISLPEVFSNKV